MTGISEERTAVGEHSHRLGDKADLHQCFQILLHAVLLVEEPPSRADLHPALDAFLLETACKDGERIVIPGVETIEYCLGECVVTVELAEKGGQFFHVDGIFYCVEARIGTDLFEHALGVVAERADMVLLYPAVLYVLLAKEYEDIALILVLLLLAHGLAAHALEEHRVRLLIGCRRIVHDVERVVGEL